MSTVPRHRHNPLAADQTDGGAPVTPVPPPAPWSSGLDVAMGSHPGWCPTKTRHPRRVVILTALELEYNAVREQLDGFTAYQHPAGTLFEIAGRPCCPGSIAIGVTGIGIPGAAVLTERAITVFQPDALLFIGIAGALVDELALGDVVVATKMYAFHCGKAQKGGFRARPHAWDAPHRLEQLARHLARTGSWNTDGGTAPDVAPTVHFKPIAAGDVVLNSRTTTLARQIRRHYDDAAAIDMEGAGVAQAGHLNQPLPVLIIRGIADRTDGERYSADSITHQHIAALHAARFGVSLASAIIHDPLGAGLPAHPSNAPPIAALPGWTPPAIARTAASIRSPGHDRRTAPPPGRDPDIKRPSPGRARRGKGRRR